jgi:CO/xanthine dehydrogenase FAD-binding subunit
MGPVPERLAADDLHAVVERLEPEDDIHATAAYRRWLAERLGARAARRAREAA